MARIFFIVFIFSGLYAQCEDYNQLECSNNNCNWVEVLETMNCSSLSNSSSCSSYSEYGCSWEFSWGGWQNYGSYCAGGTFQVDNSYCQEIQMPECSEYYSESGCNHNETCEWIPDIEYDACQSLNQSNCNTENGCDWEIDIQYGYCSNLGSSSCDATPGCWGAYTNPGWYYGWYCAGGTYIISDNSYCSGDIDNSYCIEAYDIGDLNIDGDINILDIVELVDIVLSANQYSFIGDTNSDGVNNILDIILLVSIIFEED